MMMIVFVFCFNIFFLPQKRQEEDASVYNIDTANPDGFEQIDPPIRVLDYFFK
jgi:hypothetical protein